MAYYYSQVQTSNQQGISLAGIAGNPVIRFKLATDYSAGNVNQFTNWYTHDGRWPSNDGASYIFQNPGSGVTTNKVSNLKINNVTVTKSDFHTAVADDVLEFTASDSGAEIILFNRYTLDEAANTLGIYELEIDDNNGTHVFDIAGTSSGSNIPDSLGLITATVENAPADDSQWVSYDDGGSASDDLLADDLQSESTVATATIGQVHALTANSLESASTVTQPVIGQAHNLTATSIESASNTTQPAIGQAHNFTATSLESASTTTSPALGTEGTDALSADDLQSAAQVSQPAIAQVHSLTAQSLDSTATVTRPELTSVAGTDNLTAQSLEAGSSVTSPAITQSHILTAQSLESTTAVNSPVFAQTHNLIAVSLSSATTVRIAALNAELYRQRVQITGVYNRRVTLQGVYNRRVSA